MCFFTQLRGLSTSLGATVVFSTTIRGLMSEVRGCHSFALGYLSLQQEV